MLLDFLEPPQDLAYLLRGIRHRVQADDRVPSAKAQALQGGRRDALGIVGSVVGLQAAAQGSRQADGGVAVGGDGDLRRGVNQIQVAHNLADRRHHLRGQSPAYSADVRPGGGLRENPLPQFGHRPALNLTVGGAVHIVLDDPGHLVVLVGHRRVLPELLQGHGGEHHLGGDPLPGILRRQASQFVPGFLLVGLGQHLL